jgi:membrane fusion protein, hemolysin D
LPHQDAGFVETGQRAKVKLAAYPFQRFGMVEGSVIHVSPDSSDLPQASNLERRRSDIEHVMPASGYRALVALDSMALESAGKQHRFTPGMQVSAEVHLGTRSVLEYLLSPVRKVAHEAAREP